MTIPMWLFVLLICTNAIVWFVLFLIIYFFAGIHDLFLVKYDKSTEGEESCPYEVDKEEDK